MDKYSLAAIAIIAIMFIEIVALLMGHNGQLQLAMLAGIAAVMAGTVGYGVGKVKP